MLEVLCKVFYRVWKEGLGVTFRGKFGSSVLSECKDVVSCNLCPIYQYNVLENSIINSAIIFYKVLFVVLGSVN